MKAQPQRNIKIIYRGIADRQKTQANREYTETLKGKLDIRDQIIRLPLDIHLQRIPSEEFKDKCEGIILPWLVDIVESILSITFRHILEERLTMEEGKSYAAKNILLNIKELCEQIGQYQVGRECMGEQFMEFLDSSLNQIVTEVINKYPQTSSKGASKRVRKFIKKISNRQNDQYDFLYNHRLKIAFKNNGDYSSEIMLMLNKIIGLPLEEDSKDQSLFEAFKAFCRQSFFYASKEIMQPRHDISSTSRIIIDALDAITMSDNSKTNHMIETVRPYDKMKDVEDFKLDQRQKSDAYEEIARNILESTGQLTEDLIEFEKDRGKYYAIGQKIPSQVKLFSEKDIKSGHFKIQHSSVLRVITKWTQELRDKFEKADELIRYRIHKFKSNSQGLRFCRIKQKEFLYEQANKQREKIQTYLHNLKQQNKHLQSTFAKQVLQGKYIKKYTNVGIFAGRLQQIVSQYIFKYLNRLIHSLLSVSYNASENMYEFYKYHENNEELGETYLQELADINLVTFKVGDLVRARYSCMQFEFMNLLGILYKIEEIDNSFLKVIKIKNRLDEKDNDILINLFFKDQVICELQLSIHRQQNSKEKLYSEFNHFLYELKRSQLGIISELSSIVAQHDPIVNYFTFNQHKPPVVIKLNKIMEPVERSMYLPPNTMSAMAALASDFHVKRKISDALGHRPIVQKSIDKPFVCDKCGELRIISNSKFYYREKTLERYCNDCIELLLFENPSMHIDILRDLFKYYVYDEYLDQFLSEVELWNPSKQLASIRNERQLYINFLDAGFFIEKGDKTPVVRFFKKFYNEMNNKMVLTTRRNGEIDNFLHLDCKKQKLKPIYQSQVEKFLFFRLINNSKQKLYAMIEEYISEEYNQIDFKILYEMQEGEVLKKDYLQYIFSSFQKYHPTLYLNNYKHVMDYLNEYLQDPNSIKKSRKNDLFEYSASCVNNLLLEDSAIYVLHPFLAKFTNLRQINLSHNNISHIHQLTNLRQLQNINLTQNKILTLQPLTRMPWLKVIIAANNSIANLDNFSNISDLRVLDCSFNNIIQLGALHGLFRLQELMIGNNWLENMKGISKLTSLRILDMNTNSIKIIEEMGSLFQLTSINLQSNRLKVMDGLPRLLRLTRLNLSHNSISQISVLNASCLQQLDLSSNKIEKIENLSHLSDLILLNLQDNQIKRLQNLQPLQKLKTLILNKNKIIEIENMQSMKSIEILKMESNPISQIKNLGHFKYLTLLYMQNCAIERIQQMNKLKRLKALNLSSNKLNSIDNLDELVKLQRLDLSHNIIVKIENLNTLKYLQNLSLRDNQIKKIENLEQLIELNQLILSDNQIEVIEGLDGLAQLQILHLEDNKIRQISGINNLIELNELWLSNNKISCIKSIGCLKHIKKIGLAHNLIEKIEGLDELATLEFLDIQKNQITVLQGLLNLKQLKCLVLSSNFIIKIQNLDNMQQLQTLILNDNKISKMQNLDKLRNLSYLILSFNKIDKIEGLNELKQLEKLQLAGNQITKIQGLQRLKKMSELGLENNAISEIQNLDTLTHLKVLNLSNNNITLMHGFQKLKGLTKLHLTSNKIEFATNTESLPYLQQLNLRNNPLRNATQYKDKNTTLNLCIDVIVEEFQLVTQHLLESHFPENPSNKRENYFPRRNESEKVNLLRSITKTYGAQI